MIHSRHGCVHLDKKEHQTREEFLAFSARSAQLHYWIAVVHIWTIHDAGIWDLFELRWRSSCSLEAGACAQRYRRRLQRVNLRTRQVWAPCGKRLGRFASCSSYTQKLFSSPLPQRRLLTLCGGGTEGGPNTQPLGAALPWVMSCCRDCESLHCACTWSSKVAGFVILLF